MESISIWRVTALTLISLLTLSLNGKVIHEQPPSFVGGYPLTLELLFSVDEDINIAYINILNNHKSIKKTMSCRDNRCEISIPTDFHTEFIEYRLEVFFCNGRVQKSPIIKIPRVETPKWQDNSINFLTVSSQGELRGFEKEHTLLKRDINSFILKESVYKDTPKSNSNNWWNPLNWFSFNLNDSDKNESLNTNEYSEDISLNEQKEKSDKDSEDTSSTQLLNSLRSIETP
jgi:hypothetical protein